VKEFVPALWDDLELAADPKNKIPADHTRFLGWQGSWYELDLTEDHTQEIEAFLARYIRAGHKPEAPPRPKKAQTGPGYSNEAHERNQRIVEWAQANGYKTTPKAHGGVYIPVRTQRAWDEHEAKMEEVHGLGGDRPE
jgi:hypothetical protein